ncbi:unnamed protein product [Taenia asiatica]|uniref:RRM domain-containing protein n=1 Tax=Taenia asiatica TaxID=60517 RepID=A0A0R3WFX9_TAEAS|nr:unnamed protein product [Taenia asiatica]
MLRTRCCSQASHLRNLVEQATLELKEACNRSFDRSTTKLNDLFDEHQAELNISKGAIFKMQELIEKYEWRKQLISQLTLDPLLSMRDVLKGLIEALMTLSLIDVADQEETGHQSSGPSPPALASSLASTPPLEGRSKVFVRGISRKMTVISLQSAFSKLGPVQKVDAYPTRGYAIVEFRRHETVKLAISAHWHTVDGELVEIRPFIPKLRAKKSTEERETL